MNLSIAYDSLPDRETTRHPTPTQPHFWPQSNFSHHQLPGDVPNTGVGCVVYGSLDAVLSLAQEEWRAGCMSRWDSPYVLTQTLGDTCESTISWRWIPIQLGIVISQYKDPTDQYNGMSLLGGFKYVLCSVPKLGKWSNLMSIFFRWVGSTTD